MRFKFSILFLFLAYSSFGQTNWKKDSLNVYNTNDSLKIWRKGAVAISHAFISPYQNKLLVTDKYLGKDNRAMYLSLNEPRVDLPVPDTTTVGLATDVGDAHNVFTANHFANFKTGTYFSDVHNSTAELNFVRGSKDIVGFRDGGHLAKSSVLKVSGTFSNNQRTYRNTEFDLINLRFFTDAQASNLSIIDNFYALRMEDFRGINTNIIQNGWGIFIKPTILKNFFGGNVGIGTQNVTHKLTVEAASNPLKITGFSNAISPNTFLAINASGEVSKSNLSDQVHSFLSTNSDETLSDLVEIYIHKGGDAVFTLPAAATRIGKIWKISNIGTGTLTLSVGFYEGNELRTTILNKAGANSFSIFSDGTDYISIK